MENASQKKRKKSSFYTKIMKEQHMIIHQIAEFPDTDDKGDIIRFLLQSLSVQELPTINFLVSLLYQYNYKGYLTDKQEACYMTILENFLFHAKKQFPHMFVEQEPIVYASKKVKGFTVHEGGKK